MNLNHIAKKPFFDLFYKTPCMALLLRAAYHDAGTFCKDAQNGGPRGTLRFKAEFSRQENQGIYWAMEQIEDIKHHGNHITTLLSYSDLIQLGGYAAVEYCGGPSMIFKMGRIDAEEVSPENRLPEANEPKMTQYEKLMRLGFSDQDFVAIMGSHTLGFAHKERSGFEGRWTMNPHVFDNTYFKEVLLGERSKYLKTPAEWLLNENPKFRKFCEMYADDQNLFFSHYSDAHVKMSELGQQENLMCEIDEKSGNKPSGYEEPLLAIETISQ